MAGPDREAIDTFTSITGSSSDIAIRKLEEHSGDLNAAINSYFADGDRITIQETSISTQNEDLMDIDNADAAATLRNPLASTLDPSMTASFAPQDPYFRTTMFGTYPRPMNNNPFVSHPREVREIPIEVKDGGYSGREAIIVEDVTDSQQGQGPGIRGTVIVPDEDDEDDASDAYFRAPQRSEGTKVGISDISNSVRSGPTAPSFDEYPEYSNDIEEEMIKAAIEASKLEVQAAEQEKAVQDLRGKNEASDYNFTESAVMEAGQVGQSNVSLVTGNPSIQDEGSDAEEKSHTLRRLRRGPRAKGISDVDITPSIRGQSRGSYSNGNSFQSEEWGGISSEEHEEAIMLEAAMFGGVSEGAEFKYGFAPHQVMRQTRPPSPSLQAQRDIREQQDDEYFASLAADREKEIKAKEEAEARRVQEQAERDAFLAEETKQNEEKLRKLEEENKLEKLLAEKESSLPEEPEVDNENSITLLVRMPDGTRRGRRFLKSNSLQSLFDYIDTGRAVKPGSYRLVRPFPRRAFAIEDCSMTLKDLGLTDKQEALFLEFI